MIKRQLSRMLPGISVFLDVDDLDDIAHLPQYIADSSVVLAFLSKGVNERTGYLQSASCRKELRRAHELAKPLILVFEPESLHGGCPWSEWREEVALHLHSEPACKDYLLGEEERRIPWERNANRQDQAHLKQLPCVATNGF